MRSKKPDLANVEDFIQGTPGQVQSIKQEQKSRPRIGRPRGKKADFKNPVKFSATLEQENHSALKIMAVIKHTTMVELINEIISEWAEKEELLRKNR